MALNMSLEKDKLSKSVKKEISKYSKNGLTNYITFSMIVYKYTCTRVYKQLT